MTPPRPCPSPRPRRHCRAEWPLLAALAAAPCLVLARVLWRGAIPFFMDPAMYFFPLRVQAARVLAAGEWPFWNRAIMGGAPLWANPQSAVAYPLNWPSLAWPTGFWFTFPQVLQLGLYGALTAWALRRAGASLAAAAWAGALALAGGYGWSRLQFGNFMNVLPWWPLWLGAALCFINSKSEIRNPKQIQSSHDANENAPEPSHAPFSPEPSPTRFSSSPVLCGALAVAMLLLGGAHQPAAYGLAALALASLAMAAMAPRGRRRAWIVFAAVTFACGGLLAAPGWLPQAAFLRETARAQNGLEAGQVLDGSVGSLGQLATSLLGDWPRGLAVAEGRAYAFPGGRWADAEAQADVGAVALLVALVPAMAGRRRRLWIALWIAALATGLLAWRPVVALSLRLAPATGVFHDPRRWLGATQWLLIMAAGLGADRLWRAAGRRWISGAPGASFAPSAKLPKAALAAVLALAVAAQGWLTWATTDLATIPARALTDPKPAPLLARAGLRPGERFFSLDWQRASSYDFRRPDLTDWALPNLAMLWGYEDLGGYEPAQPMRWRAWIDGLNGGANNAWRRLWPSHFALVTAPWNPELLAPANVRAAILPRWGAPLYFRQQDPSGRAWGAIFPAELPGRLDVQAVLDGGDGAALSLRDVRGVQAGSLAAPRNLGLADDLAWSAAENASATRPAPPGRGRLRAARGSLVMPPPGAAQASRSMLLAIASQARMAPALIDVFCWNDALASAWRPVACGQVATLMTARRPGSRATWLDGAGRVLNETIRHDRLDLTVEATSPGGATLVVGDAWWPGWRARLEDGRAVPLAPAGPWRAARLPAGRHVLTMTYVPDGLPLSLVLALAGLAGLAAWMAGPAIALAVRRRRAAGRRAGR